MPAWSRRQEPVSKPYQSLWKARADLLASVSEILSTMSDVRAAFSTRDQATIQDTAAELWSKVSSETAFFLVSPLTIRDQEKSVFPGNFGPQLRGGVLDGGCIPGAERRAHIGHGAEDFAYGSQQSALAFHNDS